MLSQPLLLAINTAPALEALHTLRLGVWSAHAEDRLTDAEAAELEAAVEARRRALKGLGAAPGQDGPSKASTPLTGAPGAPEAPGADSGRTGHGARPLGASRPLVRLSRFSTGRKPPKSPDREASRVRALDRIRSNPLPASIRGLTFMTVAVLAVIAEEVVERGMCALTHGEIATRAGGSVSTAKRAIGAAFGLGLIDVTVRPRPLAPNLPNLIRVVCPRWLAWLAKRPARMRRPKNGAFPQGGGRGSKRTAPINNTSFKTAMNAVQGVIEGVGKALAGPEPPPGQLRGA